VEHLRSSLLIEVHHLGGVQAHADNSSDEEDSTGDHSSDEDNFETLERDKRLLDIIRKY
jgi:hypothetical protein